MPYPEQRIETLTEREYDVLRGIGQGLSNAEIAEQLTISPATVKWYTRQIYSKLELDNHEDKRAAAAEMSRAVGAAPSAPQATPDLPPDVTPFIGRADAINDLSAMFRADFPRMVTVVGLGGAGKTRLALQVGRRVREDYGGHVYFVSLKTVHDRENLFQTVAQAVGCPLNSTQDWLAMIAAHLSEQRTLLILDNAEHLVSLAATFVALLERVPALRLLLTSRQRMGLTVETVYALDGLAYPAEMRDGQPLAYDAVVYFVDVVRRLNPRWQPDRDDLKAVIDLCHLVDGLPLALQLAALRSAQMTLPQIVAEVRTGNRVLSSRSPDLPEKQRSIETIIQAMYQALAPQQQPMYAALGLFVGDFSREAAQAIAGMDDDAIQQFVQRGILELFAPGRFNLHPLVQRHALNHLEAGDDHGAALQHFVDYYADFAEQLAPTLVSGLTLNVVEREWAHIRAAWRYAVQASAWTQLYSFLDCVHFFTWRRTAYDSGIALLQEALNAAERHHPESQIALDLYVRFIHMRTFLQAMNDAEFVRLERTVAALAAFDDQYAYAFGLSILSTEHRTRRQLAESEQLAQTALSIWETLGQQWGTALSAYQLGVVRMMMDDAAATRAYLQRSEQLNQSVDDWMLAAMLQTRMAELDRQSGEHERALARLDEAMVFSIEIRDWDMQASVANNASVINFSLGQFDAARQLRAISLAYYQWLGNDVVAHYLQSQAFYEALLKDDLEGADETIHAMRVVGEEDVFIETCVDHLRFSREQSLPSLQHLTERIEQMNRMRAGDQAVLTATLILGVLSTDEQHQRVVTVGSRLAQMAYSPRWLAALPVVRQAFVMARQQLSDVHFERLWASTSESGTSDVRQLIAN